MTMNTTIVQNITEIVREHISWDYAQTLTKYSYIDQWAFDFVDFTQNSCYQWYVREIEMLKNMHFISSYEQIIDLGPWNGVKWSLIMQTMADQLQRYVAMDISHQMLDLARQNQWNTVSFQKYYIHNDFDIIANIQQYMDRSSLLMILWNTITNLVDTRAYLRELYTILVHDDILLLGIEVCNRENIHALVDEYNTPENRILTFRPLEYIWVPQDSGYVDIIFNPEMYRIEEWFIVQQEVYVNWLCIPRNTRILLSITNKPTLNELISSIEESWFQIRQMYNNQEQYIICLWI